MLLVVVVLVRKVLGIDQNIGKVVRMLMVVSVSEYRVSVVLFSVRLVVIKLMQVMSVVMVLCRWCLLVLLEWKLFQIIVSVLVMKGMVEIRLICRLFLMLIFLMMDGVQKVMVVLLLIMQKYMVVQIQMWQLVQVFLKEKCLFGVLFLVVSICVMVVFFVLFSYLVLVGFFGSQVSMVKFVRMDGMFLMMKSYCQLVRWFMFFMLFMMSLVIGLLIVLVMVNEVMNRLLMWVWCLVGNQQVRYSIILGKKFVLKMFSRKCRMQKLVGVVMQVMVIEVRFQRMVMCVSVLWVLIFFSSRLFGILKRKQLMKKILVFRLYIVFENCRFCSICSLVKLMLM